MHKSFASGVRDAIAGVLPRLKVDGGGLKLLGSDNGHVSLELTGACKNCPFSATTIAYLIRANIMNVPGVVSVQVI